MASKRRRFPKHIRALSVWRLATLLIVYGIAVVGAGLYFVIAEFAQDLPDDLLASARDYQPARATKVFSADGEPIGEFYLQKREPVRLDRIPTHVRQAFISAEDQRFHDHRGFDPIGIARAAYTNWRSGEKRQGASTITQQVTRMLMLSNERSYARKVRELILAVRVERELSKRDILEIYLNHVYLGNGAYGVGAAADVYFGKNAEDLTTAEAALLAGLVQGPTRMSPHRNYPAARSRQRYVLSRMAEDGYLTDAQLQAALAEPLALLGSELPLNHVAAPYFVEHIRQWAIETFGHRNVFHHGLRIYTTLDMKMQRSAEAAARDGVAALDRRIGFRGPAGHLQGDDLTRFTNGPARPYTPGLEVPVSTSGELFDDFAYLAAVTRISRWRQITVDFGPVSLVLDRVDARQLLKWRDQDRQRLRVGDLIPAKVAKNPAGQRYAVLAQPPEVQAAVVVIDPNTARVEAMVGGLDYAHSQFNRALQANRQIGSAMKPFIYATALESGMTHIDVLRDRPIAVKTAGGVWTPQNYDRRFAGPVTLRTALARSLNTISVQLVSRIGLKKVKDLMSRLGIQSPIPDHISIALGTPDLTLMEVTAAMAAFPNGGRRVVPRYVDLVTTGEGVALADYRQQSPSDQVISPQLAYLTVNLMETVVARGTARRALTLERPAAGKTGTSHNHKDAWFIGYTRDRIAGVWVGRDDSQSIGGKATGGSAALPIWLQFMASAHPETVAGPFVPPPDIYFMRANEMTGRPAAPGSGAAWIPFQRGTVPTQFGKN